MTRITLDRLELKQKIKLSLSIAMARHSSIRTDLLNPRTSETAERRRDFATERLADYLTEDFFISRHEVSRESEASADVEEMMHRLRVKAAEREEGDDGRKPDAQEPQAG